MTRESDQGAIHPRDRATYMLDRGFIYFSRRPAVVQAILGSCVSVCIWDQRLKFGGMNHFCEPATSDAADATPRYGNVATAALIRMMEEAGCKRTNLVAQIFGGGNRRENPGNSSGEENVSAARAVLRKKKIKVVSEDVGGGLGRKIAFDTSTGKVGVLKVQNLRSSDWH